MTTPSSVTVIPQHETRYINQQDTHRTAEGIPLTSGEPIHYTGVTNVRIERTDGFDPDIFDAEYPVIHLTFADGHTETLRGSIKDDETDPLLDIWKMENGDAREEFTKIKHFDHALGFHQYTSTNSFENEITSEHLYIQNPDGQYIQYSPPTGDGYIIKRPSDHIEVVDSPTKFNDNPTYKHKPSPDDFSTHPYKTNAGTLTITADGHDYTDIAFVSRARRGHRRYILHTHSGGLILADDITDVTGPLFTVCATFDGRYGPETRSLTRGIGVYIQAGCGSWNEPSLMGIGHPRSSSTYKAPITYQLAPLSKLTSLVIKTPTGDILNSPTDLSNAQQHPHPQHPTDPAHS